MSINPPRYPGHYALRHHDCQAAIERDFLREMVNTTTPYVDLDRVLTEIAEEATAAGWSEEELTDAVLALAKRHKWGRRGRAFRLQLPDRREFGHRRQRCDDHDRNPCSPSYELTRRVRLPSQSYTIVPPIDGINQSMAQLSPW